MKKLSILIILFLSLLIVTSSTTEKDIVHIKNNVFEVHYSQKLEEPIWLIYKSTNRPTNVNRGSMDFYSEQGIHTSDNHDYKNNLWDKGHLAPAATFSDNMENLKQTFSYLNCALQHQDLNRSEWRLLEEQERVWDDNENLTVTVELVFNPNHKVLSTGGHVPDNMVKHIYFEKSKKWMCYDFPNVKPTKGWEEHQVKHTH